MASPALKLVRTFVVCASLLSLLSPCFAAPIPSKADDGVAPVATRESDLKALSVFLARDEVTKALQARGLSTQQVEDRLARLSDDDLRSLASNLDQIQAAGTNVPDYIWILLAAFLIVLIVVAIV